MDRSEAIKILCMSAGMRIARYIFDSALDALANAPPIYRATVYYFLLTFILVALVSAHQAYTRRPGTFTWDCQLRDIEETSDFLKFALLRWLLLFNFAIGFEVFVLGVYAFTEDLRQVEYDEPDYLPVLLRLNWANISWLGSTVGEWLWRHVEYYWSELEAFLGQLLREQQLREQQLRSQIAKSERQIRISSFVLMNRQYANLRRCLKWTLDHGSMPNILSMALFWGFILATF